MTSLEIFNLKKSYHLSDEDISLLKEEKRKIIKIYNTTEEIGNYYIKKTQVPYNLLDYFDIKKFGEDIVDNNFHFIKLPSNKYAYLL